MPSAHRVSSVLLYILEGKATRTSCSYLYDIRVDVLAKKSEGAICVSPETSV